MLPSARRNNARRFASRSYTVGLIAILWVAVALRLWNLGTQSLWHDEAWSIFSAYHPLAWGAQGTDPNAPALFYLSLGAWMQFVGDGVWLLRLWSVLWGVLTVALAGSIGRRWFNPRVGLLAAFLVAVSPILWVYSQEIRAYVVMPGAALVLLLLLDRLLQKPSRRLWIWLAVVELLTLYTHNLAVPLIAWLNVTAALAWLIRRDRSRLLLWIAVQTVLGIAYIPWLATQRPTGTPLNTPPPIRPSVVWDIWQAYFSGIKTLVGADPTLMALTAIFGGVAIVLVLIALLRRRSARLYLIVSQAILVPIFEMAIIWAAHIDFHPRYFIVGVPAALIALAVGADAAQRPASAETRPADRADRRISRLLTGEIALFAALIMVDMAHTTFSSPVYQHDDFRAIAAYYATLPPTYAIVIPYNWEPTLAYYAPKMNIRAPIIGIPLGNSWPSIVDRLNAIHADHIEVLTWYQLPADLRGAYPCLLGAVTNSPPHTLTVNGLTTIGYDHPDPITVQATTDGQLADVAPFTSGAVRMVTNGRRICLLTDWTATADPKALHDPARVNIGLVDPLGDVFTHNDGDLRDDHQTPTPFWSIGTTATAFTLIDDPIGTPSGAYPVWASLYTVDSTDVPHGLDVLQNGTPIGQRAVLGNVPLPPAIPDPAAEASIPFQTVGGGASAALINGLPNATDPSAACTVQPGDSIRLTLLWRYAAPISRSVIDQTKRLGVRFSGSNWTIAQTGLLDTSLRINRQWLGLTIPTTASGSFTIEALVSNGDGSTLSHPIGTCAVVPSAHDFNPPAIAHPLAIHYPGVGTLVGYDTSQVDLIQRTPFTLTLFWQTDGASPIPYTVFTHLLDRDGHVIAQNDSPPRNGDRPTTGWVSGEYITDPHLLTFNQRANTDLSTSGAAISGSVSLEVGLYDPATGKRVLLANGADHAVLALPDRIAATAAP